MANSNITNNQLDLEVQIQKLSSTLLSIQNSINSIQNILNNKASLEETQAAIDQQFIKFSSLQAKLEKLGKSVDTFPTKLSQLDEKITNQPVIKNNTISDIKYNKLKGATTPEEDLLHSFSTLKWSNKTLSLVNNLGIPYPLLQFTQQGDKLNIKIPQNGTSFNLQLYNNQQAEQTSNVTSVKIESSINGNTINEDVNSVQFISQVYGNGDYSQDVKWEAKLMGDYNCNFTMSQQGKLTIIERDTSDAIMLVTCTSLQNPSVYIELIFIIKKRTPQQEQPSIPDTPMQNSNILYGFYNSSSVQYNTIINQMASKWSIIKSSATSKEVNQIKNQNITLNQSGNGVYFVAIPLNTTGIKVNIVGMSVIEFNEDMQTLKKGVIDGYVVYASLKMMSDETITFLLTNS